MEMNKESRSEVENSSTVNRKFHYCISQSFNCIDIILCPMIRISPKPHIFITHYIDTHYEFYVKFSSCKCVCNVPTFIIVL